MSWDQLWVLDKLPQGEGNFQRILNQGMPGGCALNTACDIRVLEPQAKVTLVGNSLGDDLHGNQIRMRLERLGVDHRLCVSSSLITPFCQVFVEEGTGRRSFVLDHRDIQKFETSQLESIQELATLRSYTHVFVQAYVRTLAERCLDLVEQDSSNWIMTQDIDPDSEFVPRVDAVQISETDWDFVDWNRESIERLAQRYFQGRCSVLLVTGGERGVYLCEKNQPVQWHPALSPRKIVDGTGCGDAFRAGFMLALSYGESYVAAVREGQEAAVQKLEVFGSNLMDCSIS